VQADTSQGAALFVHISGCFRRCTSHFYDPSELKWCKGRTL